MTPRPPDSTRPDTRFPYRTLVRSMGWIGACDARRICHLRQADDRPVLAELDAKDRHQLCNVLAARGRVPAGLDLLANRLGQPRRRLGADLPRRGPFRSEEHTSELQSLMRISYAVFCLKKKTIISLTRHYNHYLSSTHQKTHTR